MDVLEASCITPKMVAEHGLSPEEYERVLHALGREPNLLELGIFSVISGWSEYILPQVLAPRNDVQVLSVYLAALVNDDTHFDFHMFKAVGLFYALPIFVIYLFFQNKLMTIYGGGTKG